MVSIPILVVGLDPAGEEFTEESRTVMVNREGALILLKHDIARESPIRIINLQTDAAADCRIVGPTCMASSEGTEWGVEYLKADMAIWGIDFPSKPEEAKGQASALLECQTCQKKSFWPLTLAEVEVLDATGIIQNVCTQCHRSTDWIYADPTVRPPQLYLSGFVSASPQKNDERREVKRLLMKLPVLVKNQKGETEATRTENLSRADFAVALALDLAVGDFVTVICPLTESGKNQERSAKILRSENSAIKGRKLYGIRFSPPAAPVT